jgi:hypothetical protein
VTKAVAFILLFALTNASLLLLFPFSAARLLLTMALYVGGTGVMLVILFHPGSRWLLDRQTEVPCASHPCVALTFDDGPSPEVTPRVLDILRERQAKATFFLVGQQVERNPGLARRVSHEGHVIGNHTWTHPLAASVAGGSVRDRRAGCPPQSPASGPASSARRPCAPDPRLALERAASSSFVGLRTYDTRARSGDAAPAHPGARAARRDRLLHDRPGPGAPGDAGALPGNDRWAEARVVQAHRTV